MIARRPSAFALDVGDAVVEGVAQQQGSVEAVLEEVGLIIGPRP